MSFACYIRVNSINQEESLRIQRDKLRKYCEANGIADIQEFIDYSSGLERDRKGLSKLKKEISEGKCNAVIVDNASRLSRNVNDFMELYSFFEDHNVELHSIGQGIYNRKMNLETSLLKKDSKSERK